MLMETAHITLSIVVQLGRSIGSLWAMQITGITQQKLQDLK